MRIGVVGAVKVPAAGVQTGVGTGATEVGLAGHWSAMGNRSFAVADFGDWWLGDRPDLALDDLITGRFTMGRSFGEMGRFSAMLRWEAATAVIPQVDPRYSVGVGLGVAVAREESLTLAVDRGTSETASDWRVTVRWRHGVPAGGWGGRESRPRHGSATIGRQWIDVLSEPPVALLSPCPCHPCPPGDRHCPPRPGDRRRDARHWHPERRP